MGVTRVIDGSGYAHSDHRISNVCCWAGIWREPKIKSAALKEL